MTDDEVIHRAGPSDKFPETGKIPRGTRVVVEREADNGWLEITAPAGWMTTCSAPGFDALPYTLTLVCVIPPPVCGRSSMPLSSARLKRSMPSEAR